MVPGSETAIAPVSNTTVTRLKTSLDFRNPFICVSPHYLNYTKKSREKRGLPEFGSALLRGEEAGNPGASSLRARGPRRQRPGPFQDRSPVGAPFFDHGERQLATGNGPVIGPERPGGIADPAAEAVIKEGC